MGLKKAFNRNSPTYTITISKWSPFAKQLKKECDEHFERFIQDRNNALLSLDKDKILFYVRKYKVNFPCDNDEVFWRAVHKAILWITGLTQAEYKRSYDWLKSHGSEIPEGSCYTEDDDKNAKE